LPTFQNNHEIQFHFEHDGPLPSRIAVVIGKNGVGKSQTLAHLVEALLRGDTNSLRDTLEGRPVINRLLAVSSPGETYTTFPPVPRFPGRINYRRIFLSRRQFGNKELGLGQVLVELSRSEESIKSRGRWNLFCETIRSIVPPEELFMRVKNSGKAVTPQWLREPFPLIELQEGNSRRRLERWSAVDLQADVCRYIGGEVIPLSSGQLTFIRFAVQACLYVENGTLFLCDEPETHLHPNYISAFIGLLDRLLAETGSFAILATHSAYFVREVARSQVIVLRQTKDRQIEVVTPRLKTLGADIGEISHFVFEDTYFGSLLGQVRGRLIADPEQAANVLETLESEVSTEALMSLQRELPPAAK
jgi:energy-coupling factor transporter ATP-binding protein EcfA2